MDYPPAPAIVEHLREVVLGGDYGYPDWPSYTTSPMAEVFADRMLAAARLAHLPWARAGVLRRAPGDPDGLPPHDVARRRGGDAHPVLPAVPRHVEGDGPRPDRRPGRPHTDGLGVRPRRARPPADQPAPRRRGGRAKALLLCNPHNPTGHVFTAAELRQRRRHRPAPRPRAGERRGARRPRARAARPRRARRRRAGGGGAHRHDLLGVEGVQRRRAALGLCPRRPRPAASGVAQPARPSARRAQPPRRGGVARGVDRPRQPTTGSPPAWRTSGATGSA